MRELTAKAQRAGFHILRCTHLGAPVFPTFSFVKRHNCRYLKLLPEEKAALTRQMMRTTGYSAAMGLELFLGRLLPYPAGIRCVAVLPNP